MLKKFIATLIKIQFKQSNFIKHFNLKFLSLFRERTTRGTNFLEMYGILYLFQWIGMFTASAILMPLNIILWCARIIWFIPFCLPSRCSEKCKKIRDWPADFPNSKILYIQVPKFFFGGILLISTFPVWIMISIFIKLSDVFYWCYYINRTESYSSNSCWVPFKKQWVKAMPIIKF